MSRRAPVVIFGYRIRVRAFRRDLSTAFRTLIGATTGDRKLLEYLSNRDDFAQELQALSSEMPQARLLDASVVAYHHDDWRLTLAKQLTGHGLEIGPLHRPIELPAGVTSAYLDREDVQSLKARFPEVADGITRVDLIDDAETLAAVPDESFDFLVAAHVFEHVRNPMATLRQWLRVVRPSGKVYLVLPDKRRTFDRHRVRTTLEHLIADFQMPSAERDFEHYLDYARFVYHSSGETAVSLAKKLAAENDRIHFHVFMPEDLVGMVRWYAEHVSPISIVAGPAESPEEDEFHLLIAKPARA